MSVFRASNLSTAALLGFLLTSCAATSEAPVKDATLTLNPQQTLALSDTINLRYENAEDSRCPQGAQCVWAGKVVYHFTLVGKAATEPFMLDIDKPHHESSALPGVRVVLATVEPPPVRLANEAPPPHPVTVSVTNTKKP